MIRIYNLCMRSPSQSSTPNEMPGNRRSAVDHAIADGLACGRITSVELLGRRRELEIVHDGCVYRLRLTLNGKLILTK